MKDIKIRYTYKRPSSYAGLPYRPGDLNTISFDTTLSAIENDEYYPYLYFKREDGSEAGQYSILVNREVIG